MTAQQPPAKRAAGSGGPVLYRVASGTRIAPFGDLVREAPVGNTPLGELHEALAAALGLEVVDVAAGDTLSRAGLAVMDDLYVSRGALDAFRQALAQRPEGTRALLAMDTASVFMRNSAPMQDNPRAPHPDSDPDTTSTDAPAEVYLMDLFGVAAGTQLPQEGGRDALTAALRDGAEHLVIDVEERVLRVDVMEHYFGKSQMELAFPLRPVMRVRHWVHLLWANQAALGVRWRELGKLKLVAWVLWSVLRGLTINRHKVLGRMNVIGPGCDIHPSAVVEGSVLGPGCQIGPHARVRFSKLGANVVLQGGAQVEYSTLGDQTMVSQNCAVNFCVTYPMAAVGQFTVQLSVLGRKSIMVNGSFMMDTHFGHDVKVRVDGELRNTEQRFMGCALGHEARLGSGIWIAAGRDIPNGSLIVRDSANVATKLPDTFPANAALVIRGGILELL